MFNFLEKLRQKSDSTKKQIAFGTALFVAGIILAVWFTVVYPDLIQKKAQDDKLSKIEKSPLTSITETFGSGFSAIGEEFNNLKNVISSIGMGPEYFVATSSNTTVATSTIGTTTEVKTN